MSKRKPRRQHPTDHMATVLRCHYVDKVALSAPCEDYDLQPSLVHYWLQQFRANAGAAFETPASSRERELEKKLATAQEATTKKKVLEAVEKTPIAARELRRLHRMPLSATAIRTDAQSAA